MFFDEDLVSHRSAVSEPNCAEDSLGGSIQQEVARRCGLYLRDRAYLKNFGLVLVSSLDLPILADEGSFCTNRMRAVVAVRKDAASAFLSDDGLSFPFVEAVSEKIAGHIASAAQTVILGLTDRHELPKHPFLCERGFRTPESVHRIFEIYLICGDGSRILLPEDGEMPQAPETPVNAPVMQRVGSCPGTSVFSREEDM